MTIETRELDMVMKRYSIPRLLLTDGYVKLCEAHAVGLSTIQNGIDYLSNQQSISSAEGVWLDYIGWLVGTTRGYADKSQYFSVNQPDINVQKLFYFPRETNWTQGNLSDTLFKQKIRAKIGYNISRGTREYNLFIIKNLTNADRVVITKESAMVLNVHLYGDNIIYQATNSLRNDIESVLANGVGLNKLEIN